MKLHELQQKRNNIAKEMRALHETIGDSAWDKDQQKKWDEMRHSMDVIDTQISREEEIRKLDQNFVEDNIDNINEEQRSSDGKPNSDAAFDSFVRRGMGELSAEEREAIKELRAQSVGDNTKGGFTVPKIFRDTVIESMASYGGIASVCQVLNTETGASIEWPTTDGTTDIGELVGENTQSDEGDVAFGTQAISAKKISSKVIRVSNELLNDSAINMTSFLANRIASRIGRKEAALIVNGTGAGTPTQNKGLSASVTKKHTAGSSSAIGYDDFLRLKHKIDPAYRNGASVRFAFNDNTLLAAKLLKDLDGRPLWLPAISGVAPSTIDGDQYVIDQGIADIGATAKSVFYGDFNRFILRRVNYMVLRRLVERYADYDQTGFLAFHRFDTVLEDTGAIASLDHAAS